MKVKYRVKDRQEFQNIYKNGTLLKSDTISLRYLPNNLGYARVGISVPTKSGNAVIRNKIKRQIRAILAHDMNFVQPVDVILVVRKSYKIEDFVKTESDIKELLKKVGNI